MAEKNNLIHGGAAADRAITKGAPFTGLATVRQDEVIAELENDGLESIVERNAIRLQTAADLYYNALIKAAQDGNEKQFDSYIGRFGWLTAKTLLAWREVKQNRKKAGRSLDNVLSAYSQEETQQDGKGGGQ